MKRATCTSAALLATLPLSVLLLACEATSDTAPLVPTATSPFDLPPSFTVTGIPTLIVPPSLTETRPPEITATPATATATATPTPASTATPTRTATPQLPTATLTPPPPTPAPSNCHPSYEGACLLVGAGDYDCAGGRGNGPNYTGRVYVVGPDVFDLDRDDDGIGCE